MITIKRDYFPTYTYGVWYRDDKPLGLYSIELPWKNNEKQTSCIPEGEYRCTLYNSPTKGIVYLLHDVPNRDMIEIHIGNYISDIKGCLAIGTNFGILPNKTTNIPEPVVLNSSAGLAKLKMLCNNAEFLLTIIGDNMSQEEPRPYSTESWLHPDNPHNVGSLEEFEANLASAGADIKAVVTNLKEEVIPQFKKDLSEAIRTILDKYRNL